jgi:predicted RNA-binding Zn-ribbon protein involved in translation (DUF1610 family)
MTLICPKCRSTNIDYRGVPGTEEPRYECRDCGYVGPLVLDVDGPQGNAPDEEEHETHLLCPNCGSDALENRIPSASQGTFTPRYRCSRCGYEGASALRKERTDNDGKFPYTEILVFFFLSAAWYVAGAGLQFSVLFFIVPSAVIVFFRHLLGEWPSYSVEEDLKNLNEEGLPKTKNR